jgi:ABC-type polar amino acid transport system ATPase subunit
MIEIKNLSKKFNEETILNFQDLIFENGKSYVILGPSGSRKIYPFKHHIRDYFT